MLERSSQRAAASVVVRAKPQKINRSHSLIEIQSKRNRSPKAKRTTVVAGGNSCCECEYLNELVAQLEYDKV